MLQMRLRFKPQLHFVALNSVRGTFFFLFLKLWTTNKINKWKPHRCNLYWLLSELEGVNTSATVQDKNSTSSENYIHDPIVCPRCPARVRRTCPARGPWRCAQIHPRRGRRPHQMPPWVVYPIPLSASLAWTWWLQRCLDTNAVKDIKVGSLHPSIETSFFLRGYFSSEFKSRCQGIQLVVFRESYCRASSLMSPKRFLLAPLSSEQK